MVKWIYVIECEDQNIYIGTTKRLYRRFGEHIRGNGSINTGKHKPERLIGLYKVSDNFSFLQYRHSVLKKKEYHRFIIQDWGENEEEGDLEIENHITEIYLYLRRNCDENKDFMFDDGEWNKVKGGKYTKEIWSNPINKIVVEDIMDRPCCDCKYPCEVKLSKDKNIIYFVCALKNVWEDFYQGLEITEPCDFYRVYNEDSLIKKQFEFVQKKVNEVWTKEIPVSQYKINPEPCLRCKKNEYLAVFTFGKVRRICQECFSNKYEDLKKQFTPKEICLFTDD